MHHFWQTVRVTLAAVRQHSFSKLVVSKQNEHLLLPHGLFLKTASRNELQTAQELFSKSLWGFGVWHLKSQVDFGILGSRNGLSTSIGYSRFLGIPGKDVGSPFLFRAFFFLLLRLYCFRRGSPDIRELWKWRHSWYCLILGVGHGWKHRELRLQDCSCLEFMS